MQKKKKAKKKTKKKGKKPPKKTRKPKALVLGLHGKKLQILREVPMMPCSAISKDRRGLMYAHTQATEVYNKYREKCQDYGLTIRRIEGSTTDAHRPKFFKTQEGWDAKPVPCVRFEGVWEIRDNETGQTETFGGAGDGDNSIWSANSAQTVARKQALLDYFETAWPQPTDWCRVVREELQKLKGKDFAEALKQIMPEPAYRILTATQAIKELTEYFQRRYQNAGNTRNPKSRSKCSNADS